MPGDRPDDGAERGTILPLLEGGGAGTPIISRDVENLTTTAHALALVALEDEQQTEGFKTVEAYQAAVLIGNAKARREADYYEEVALPSLLHAHNQEQPHALILCECADGRNGGLEMFSKDPKTRYPARWKPMAGLMMFPAVNALLQEQSASKPLAERLEALMSDPETKKKLFAQAEALFGRDLNNAAVLARAAIIAGKRALGIVQQPGDALATALEQKSGEALSKKADKNPHLIEKVRNMGQTFPITLELQSHSANGTEKHEHGCGAHGSCVGDALTLAEMNALVLERFLKEKYPELSQTVRISTTHHLTGKGGDVVDAHSADLRKHINSSIAALTADGRFRAKFQKDESRGIVRLQKRNPSKIEEEKHDEYIIRVSEYHKANGLEGTSVLEQCMLPDLDQMEGIIMTLIRIAQQNRIARDSTQPLFLHLDEPADNSGVADKYHQLRNQLLQNAEIQELMKTKKLYLVLSKTNCFSFTDPDRLKTEFISQDELPQI